MSGDRRGRLNELESVWRTGGEFLAQFQREPPPGSFFHPFARGPRVPAGLAVGTICSVTIRFLDRKAEFRLRVRVQEVRSEAEPRGLVFEFLPEEKDRRELVLACAEGDSIPYRRRKHHRIECELPVRVAGPSGPSLNATATSLSEGGLKLVLDRPIELETIIRMAIAFPGKLRRQEVGGRVVSATVDDGQHSLGVEFLFESQKQRDQLIKLVSALRLKLLSTTD